VTDEAPDQPRATPRVRVEAGDPVSSYTVRLDDRLDGPPAGRADFLDSPVTAGERIIFHTEVSPAFAGHGLGGVLVREALADSIRHGLTVVPVCPLFARHLSKHGDEFVAAGGAYRMPVHADIALVAAAARGRG